MGLPKRFQGKPNPRSPGELAFYTLLCSEEWELTGLPYPDRINGRCFDDRKHEVDFIWDDFKVALEIIGGKWTPGGHQAMGQDWTTFYKYNRLQVEGWLILFVPTDMVTKDIIMVWLGELLERQGWVPTPEFLGWVPDRS